MVESLARALFEQHADVIRAMAARSVRDQVGDDADAQDLEQAGLVAALKALETADTSRPDWFGYVKQRIDWRVRDAVRAARAAVKREVPLRKGGDAVEKTTGNNPGYNPGDGDEETRAKRLERIKRELGPEAFEVVQLYVQPPPELRTLTRNLGRHRVGIAEVAAFTGRDKRSVQLQLRLAWRLRCAA